MKHILITLALLCTGTLLTAQDKAALREISAAFDKIEENYEIWPHYSCAAENLEGGQAFAHHIWQSDDDSGLIRVEALNFDDHGESKTQYFIKGDKLLFVLDRNEMTPMQPKAATHVVEKRSYFAEGVLIRQLIKDGKFAAGKKTDTTELTSQNVPLDQVENAGELYGVYDDAAQSIVDKLVRLNSDDAAPASGPTAAAATTGDGWRLIEGTRSRDGQFALAWGLKGQSAPKGETDEDGALSIEPETEGLINYVVNLRTGAILGETKGSHFGDKPTIYSHYTNETVWSSASTFVAQVCTGKWATFDANVYDLQTGTSVSKGTDLLEPAKKAAREHLDGSELFKKFDKDDFAITLHDLSIAQRGSATMLVVGVSGMIPKSEEEGSYFECTVTFKLTQDENGGPPQLQWSGTEAHNE